MATDSADAIRAKLDDLGLRREARDAGDRKLAEEIREAVAEAKGLIPATEQADRLRIHRTTFYRVYR